MTAADRYSTPASFRRALTDQLKLAAKSSRWTMPQLQRQVAYDRLLERSPANSQRPNCAAPLPPTSVTGSGSRSAPAPPSATPASGCPSIPSSGPRRGQGFTST